MKINFIQNTIDLIRELFEYYNKIPNKLYYIGNRKYNNAGDMFNVTLMNYFNIPFIKARISASNIMNIGSILNAIVADKEKGSKILCKNCIIIGSGFAQEPKQNEVLIKNVDVRALRGQITKKIMENLLGQPLNCLLADPGILASYIFPKSDVIKKYKIGIIPHCYDKKADCLNNIKLQKYNYCIIDIESPVEELFEKINQCECILSSSLHGLIFADSYNIPNKMLITSNMILECILKYKDYYTGYGMELPTPINLRQDIIDDNLTDNIINTYNNVSEQIEYKQKELIKIYENLHNSI